MPLRVHGTTLPLPNPAGEDLRHVTRCLGASWVFYPTWPKTSQSIGAVLVLNSTKLLRRPLPYIYDPRFAELRLYLENDDAGDEDLNAWSSAANCNLGPFHPFLF
jgi:hypothetical protein